MGLGEGASKYASNTPPPSAPNPSQEIASCMGLELGRVKVKRFADGEIYVQLQESVRGWVRCVAVLLHYHPLLLTLLPLPHPFQEIASCMGLELGRVKFKRFAGGEIYVQLQESVRGAWVRRVVVFLTYHPLPLPLTLLPLPHPFAGDRVVHGVGTREGENQAIRRRRDLRAAAGERARVRRVSGAAHVPAGEREPHGAARHDRRKGAFPPRPSVPLSRTCPPAYENLMAAKLVANLITRAGANRVLSAPLAHLPSFLSPFTKPCSLPHTHIPPPSHQTQGRESIAAKLVANLITEAGANRVLACDLHSGQSMGYFDIPVDHVYGQPVILDYLASKMLSSNDLVVVSPDVGGVARARAFAKRLSDAPLAIVDKRRQSHNVAEVMNLIGDVKGKVAVMVDDMIDTAGTIAKGAALLHEEGASEVYACCTHAVFSPPAIERLSSGLFQEVIVTNTIPLTEDKLFPQLTVLSVANLLGETIWRVHDDTS
ncbi:unnamed protein product, partial [Closterium sp. NIES-53]